VNGNGTRLERTKNEKENFKRIDALDGKQARKKKELLTCLRKIRR
jgi:hypothetical protein